MSFQLSREQQVLLVVGIIGLYLLYPHTQEDFNITPKYWNERVRNNWSPWWYHTDGYHTAVPSITQYDSSPYKLPERISDLEDEEIIEVHQLNYTRIILAIIVALVFYAMYSTL
jgi:hypothetical protein